MKLTSFEPIANNKSKVLILGSMPGAKSLEMNQYYADQRNHFWRIIFEVFQIEMIDDYTKRCEFLLEHNIALWDVLKHCERKGSLDKNIQKEELNDISDFLKQYSLITKIFLNGGKANKLFMKHIHPQIDTTIVCKKLPSTSPIPGRNVKSYSEKVVEWSCIK